MWAHVYIIIIYVGTVCTLWTHVYICRYVLRGLMGTYVGMCT